MNRDDRRLSGVQKCSEMLSGVRNFEMRKRTHGLVTDDEARYLAAARVAQRAGFQTDFDGAGTRAHSILR